MEPCQRDKVHCTNCGDFFLVGSCLSNIIDITCLLCLFTGEKKIVPEYYAGQHTFGASNVRPVYGYIWPADSKKWHQFSPITSSFWNIEHISNTK